MTEKTIKILNNMPSFIKKDETDNNYKLVVSFNEDYTLIDNNITTLKNNLQISTATNSDLDKIGKLFKLVRSTNETDISFRSRIKAFFQSNLGGGSAPTLQSSLARSLNISEDDITITTVSENIFTISIAIDEDTDLTILNNIDIIVNKSKATGMYFKKAADGSIPIESKNNIFMINVSNVNGEDYIM